jgi:integrase
MVKLLILTGQRRTEVGALEWREIDLAKGEWTLPQARSKNHRQHIIPLAYRTLEVLQALPRVSSKKGQPKFLFTTSGDAASSGYSMAKNRLDEAIEELNGGEPISHWVFHDIRRSVASGMAGLGISPHVIEAVLNHKSGTIRGVAAVYNRYNYGPEVRTALEAWAQNVDAMLSNRRGGNVISLEKLKANSKTP